MRRALRAAIAAVALTGLSRVASAQQGAASPSPPSPTPSLAASMPHTAPPRNAPAAWPPLATWHNDVFYVSSPDRQWFIAPTGRLQLDGYIYTGDGVTSDYTTAAGEYRRPDVTNGFVLRRARIETIGGFLQRFTFMLGAEFDSAIAPLATDLIFNARIHPLLNFQLGQFDAPFTMENRTSDKYIDFPERSLAVRSFAFPSNKDIGLMAWGELGNRVFYYSIGVFNGDGQNRLNRDNYVDVMGRVFAHPLIVTNSVLRDVQIGASFHTGWRGASVDYAYPNMATRGGWAFFNSAIAGGDSPLTIVPEAMQLGVAGEIDVPIGRFDFRGEVIYLDNGTAEISAAAGDSARLAGPAQRLGHLHGIAYYAQVGCWIFGDSGINGRPGYENPPALRLESSDPPRPPLGVQLVARLDSIDAVYQGNSRSPDRSAGPADGNYVIYGAEFAANMWWTRHVRFTLDYEQYFFPDRHDGPGTTAFDENHARGPHGSNGTFGELTARVGLAL